jgi:hypothetical protein
MFYISLSRYGVATGVTPGRLVFAAASLTFRAAVVHPMPYHRAGWRAFTSWALSAALREGSTYSIAQPRPQGKDGAGDSWCPHVGSAIGSAIMSLCLMLIS